MLATKLLRHHDGPAQRVQALRAEHPPGARCQPETAADGLHRPLPVPSCGPEHPWEEIWQAIEVAVQQGKILYSGSSNFAGWHIAQAQETAARRNYNGLVSEQSIYNLLTRDVELEVIPAAQQYGLGSCPGRRCTAACWAGC